MAANHPPTVPFGPRSAVSATTCVRSNSAPCAAKYCTTDNLPVLVAAIIGVHCHSSFVFTSKLHP
eukprot:gene4883-23279_t